MNTTVYSTDTDRTGEATADPKVPTDSPHTFVFVAPIGALALQGPFPHKAMQEFLSSGAGGQNGL
jgi:hypothetical protein